MSYDSIKHPSAVIDDNANIGRDIAKNIIGRSCNYADGRKNGVRYKWIVDNGTIPIVSFKQKIEDAFRSYGVKNYNIAMHVDKFNIPVAISVTFRKV